MNNGSAPDKSQLSYDIIKKMGKTTYTRIVNIFNKVLETQEIPRFWQNNLIYPIPKKKDWHHDLNLTRPITLLETIKKIFIKTLNNRLASILTEYKILSPLNWAGLPGGGTHEPIMIINNILEDARENHKDCWVLTQDISKAYDSMDKERLED